MESRRELQTILAEVLSRHAPELSQVVKVTRLQNLSEPQRERLREALEWEFCETGLTRDDVPNRRGQLLEQLIALLPLRQQE